MTQHSQGTQGTQGVQQYQPIQVTQYFISESSQSNTKHKHFTVPVHEVRCSIYNSRLNEAPTRGILMSNNFTYVIAGGHIACNQCHAISKRSRQRCKAPAMKGKTVCLTHGGRSTGPKTEAGRLRCVEAKTIHGRETREARNERSLASARLAVLEAVGFSIGLMSGGRTQGVKPNRMAEAYPELQVAVQHQIKLGKLT